MIAIERRNGILEKLQEDKKVVVGELSQLYKVSEETIRRDLERLEKEGLCTKSYGGAVLNENNNVEMPFNVRKKSNATGKQKIAELIAGMVEDGEHILLDASTTAVYIAKALKSKRNLTVVTNSIEVLIEVSPYHYLTFSVAPVPVQLVPSFLLLFFFMNYICELFIL